MGRLMDRVMSIFVPGRDDVAKIVNELLLVKPVCHWTGGRWDQHGRLAAWNDIQNVPRSYPSCSPTSLIRTYLLRQRAA